MQWYFDDAAELDGYLDGLRFVACPMCGLVGALVRHGRRFGWISRDERGVTGRRVFCDPDSPRDEGCGHAPSLYFSGRLKGRGFDTELLWLFIQVYMRTGSVRAAGRDPQVWLSLRTCYRLRDRFIAAQSVIRTNLCCRAPPAEQGKSAGSPLMQTLSHLHTAFNQCNPLSAYQHKLQRELLALS